MGTNTGQFLSQFIKGLVTSTPTMTVALIGIIFCLSAMSRHRAAALLGLTGFVALFLEIIGMAAFWSWLPMALQGSSNKLETYFRLLGFGSNVLSAIVYGILLAAIFIGRKPAGGV
jgi:hypothetical protein